MWPETFHSLNYTLWNKTMWSFAAHFFSIIFFTPSCFENTSLSSAQKQRLESWSAASTLFHFLSFVLLQQVFYPQLFQGLWLPLVHLFISPPSIICAWQQHLKHKQQNRLNVTSRSMWRTWDIVWHMIHVSVFWSAFTTVKVWLCLGTKGT